MYLRKYDDEDRQKIIDDGEGWDTDPDFVVDFWFLDAYFFYSV